MKPLKKLVQSKHHPPEKRQRENGIKLEEKRNGSKTLESGFF